MTTDQNEPRGPTAPKSRRRSLGQRGSIAIQTALILVAVLGMVALGAEISTLLLQHRRMQTAADQAAIAGAAALNTGSDYTMEARAVSAVHGFTHGVASTTVTVNRPPTTGPKAGNPDYVEVYVGQPQTFGISQLFHSGAFSPRARGVAYRYGGSSAGFCMLAMNTTASQAVYLRNNVNMANPTCGLASNSSSLSSIYLENNASVSGPVYTHGGTFLSNGASFAQAPRISQPPLADPYAAVTIPASTTPCQAAVSVSGNGTVQHLNLSSGNCWLGWTVNNKASLILDTPGLYYVRNNVTLGQNVTITGVAGAVLVVDNNYPLVLGNSGATINLTAPTSGPYAGLAIIGRPSTINANETMVTSTQVFPNNVTLNIVGAIYFPKAQIEFDNNLLTTPGSSRCTQLIADTLVFRNNVGFNYQCAGTGVIPIGASSAALTE